MPQPFPQTAAGRRHAGLNQDRFAALAQLARDSSCAGANLQAARNVTSLHALELMLSLQEERVNPQHGLDLYLSALDVIDRLGHAAVAAELLAMFRRAHHSDRRTS